jgi:hypothetical protein
MTENQKPTDQDGPAQDIALLVAEILARGIRRVLAKTPQMEKSTFCDFASSSPCFPPDGERTSELVNKREDTKWMN